MNGVGTSHYMGKSDNGLLDNSKADGDLGDSHMKGQCKDWEPQVEGEA